MNESLTKNDLLDALAGLATKKDMDEKFSQLTTIMMDNFDRIDSTIERIDSNMEEMKEDIKIIGSHDRRIETLENHDRILKEVIEHDLHAKVAW